MAILKFLFGWVSSISFTSSGIDLFFTPGRVYFCQMAALPSSLAVLFSRLAEGCFAAGASADGDATYLAGFAATDGIGVA